MQTPEQDGAVYPLLIHDENSKLIDCSLGNAKSCNKSLEQNSLWVVDGATGRVLPWKRGGELGSIKLETPDGFSGTFAKAIVKNVQACGTLPGGTASTPDQTAAQKQQPVAQIPVGREDANFLYELEQLIHQRKIELPEGSYTTHLFKAGLSKIRKKTGEEAIELILAQTSDEVLSEASDLIYHLAVLLAELDISWSDLIAALRKRK